MDIILFDVLQTAERNDGTERNGGTERKGGTDGKDEGVQLARPHKYKRPMWFGFEVAGGGRVLQIRTRCDVYPFYNTRSRSAGCLVLRGI